MKRTKEEIIQSIIAEKHQVREQQKDRLQNAFKTLYGQSELDRVHNYIEHGTRPEGIVATLKQYEQLMRVLFPEHFWSKDQ